MAELICRAENCAHNREKYCCKGDIMVGGRHASCQGDTCCESFRKKTGDSLSSSTSHPSPTISIDCEAAGCIYNQNYKCTANRVQISGNGADAAGETSCSTFKEK